MEQPPLAPPPPAPAQHAPPTDAPPTAAYAPQPSHPSYTEMITAAIAWDRSQGKEGGSSKRAIAKYIDRVYTNLPASHSSLLTHHLRRLKSLGQLVMVKNSYQLSSAAAAAAPTPPPGSAAAAAPAVVGPPIVPPDVEPAPANPTPKRRPGRPPKSKSAQLVPLPSPAAAQVFDNGPPQPAKKRGRPPKQNQITMAAAEVPFVQPISQAQVQTQTESQLVPLNGQSGQKRRPGRPPKQQQQTPVVPFAQPVEQPVNGAATAAGVVVKRGRGRPPKSVAGVARPVAAPRIGTGRPRGRPKMNVLGPVSRPVGKRPRGRPPAQGGAGGGVAAVGMVSGRRRGRPPKGSGPLKAKRRLSGKPLGRPKKDGTAAINQQSELQIANEELRREIELTQRRVRYAVAVIRPFVANESEALAALEELEYLVIPPPVTAPPTAPPMMATPMSVMAPSDTSVPASIPAAPPVNAPPTVTVPAPPLNETAPFSATLPPMPVTAPFLAPSGIESQQSMSWNPSTDAQS